MQKGDISFHPFIIAPKSFERIDCENVRQTQHYQKSNQGAKYPRKFRSVRFVSYGKNQITGKNYPTVLWAPVSKPFPYSILYFTDEFADHGKALRKVVADFENDYDIELYSPNNFYPWINASMEIHQGTADDAVPLKWSDNLVADLTKLGRDITYFTYPGADHNLLSGWEEAVQRSLDFYKEQFK